MINKLNLIAVTQRFNSAVDWLEDGNTPTQVGYGVYEVDDYRVDISTNSCSCKDAQFRGLETPCKHIIIAWLFNYANGKSEKSPFTE